MLVKKVAGYQGMINLKTYYLYYFNNFISFKNVIITVCISIPLKLWTSLTFNFKSVNLRMYMNVLILIKIVYIL